MAMPKELPTFMKRSADPYAGMFNAFDSFAQDMRGNNNLRIDQDTARNDLANQTMIEDFQKLAGFKQAQEAGKFNVGAMTQQYGTRYSQDKLDKLKTAKLGLLRDSATNEAMGLGTTAARDAWDTSVGSDAMLKSLQAAGMDNDLAMKRSAAGATSMSAALQPGFDRQMKEATDLELKRIRESGESYDLQKDREARLAGVAPRIRESVNRGLVGMDNIKDQEGKDARLLQKQVLEQQNAAVDRNHMLLIRGQTLTPDEKRDSDFINQRGAAKTAGLRTQGLATLAASKKALDDMSQPWAPEVADQLKDITDPSKSIIQILKKKVDEGWYKGGVNAAANAFGNVTTGTDAMDYFDTKLVSLRGNKNLNDHEIAALILQTYEATSTSHDTGVGLGVNKKVFDEELKRRKGLFTKQKKATTKYAEQQLQYNTAIAASEQEHQKSVHDYVKNRKNPEYVSNLFTGKKSEEAITKAANKSEGGPSKSEVALNNVFADAPPQPGDTSAGQSNADKQAAQIQQLQAGAAAQLQQSQDVNTLALASNQIKQSPAVARLQAEAAPQPMKPITGKIDPHTTDSMEYSWKPIKYDRAAFKQALPALEKEFPNESMNYKSDAFRKQAFLKKKYPKASKKEIREYLSKMMK